MLFTIAAGFVLVATLTVPSVRGQNSVSCYYCQVSYIPGNMGTLTQYYGVDNGCGSPMNVTGSGVVTVNCRGICVTQMTYDGSGRNSVYRMCSLIKPVTGCVASTGVPRAVTCTSTCTSDLCNSVAVPSAATGV